jgi:hypothetical protein
MGPPPIFNFFACAHVKIINLLNKENFPIIRTQGNSSMDIPTPNILLKKIQTKN